MLKVKLKLTFVFIKIYINDTPYLSIRRSEYNGFQSWKNDGKYSIEFYLEGQTILTEYDKVELWLEMLEVLDEELN